MTVSLISFVATKPVSAAHTVPKATQTDAVQTLAAAVVYTTFATALATAVAAGIYPNP